MRQWLLATGYASVTFKVVEYSTDVYFLQNTHGIGIGTFHSLDECVEFLKKYRVWTVTEIVEV